MSRLWAELVKSADNKTKSRVIELERELRYLKADMLAVMEFLEEDARERQREFSNDTHGADRIVGRLSEHRKRMQEVREYTKAKSLVTIFEEDNPEYRDRKDI